MFNLTLDKWRKERKKDMRRKSKAKTGAQMKKAKKKRDKTV
jgi:hypothetical protein